MTKLLIGLNDRDRLSLDHGDLVIDEHDHLDHYDQINVKTDWIID